MKLLKASIPALDAVPEALRDYYVKQESGGYLLSVEEVGGVRLENTDGLRNGLSAEREARKRVAAKLAAYGLLVSEDGTRITDGPDGSIDPVAAREAMAKVRSGQAGTKEAAEIEQLRASLAAKAAQDREEMEQQRKTWMDYCHSIIVDDEIEKHLRATGGTDATIRVMKPIIKPFVRVEPGEGNRPRVVVLDEKGAPRISKKFGSTAPMDIGELVPTFKADRDYAVNWPGKATGGSGANHATGGSATPGAKPDLSNMSGQQMLGVSLGET